MKTLTLEKPPGFALRAASDFYSGFVPGSGMAAIDGERLTLAFRLDRSFEAVVVELLEKGDCLLAQVTGTDDAGAVSTQLKRMLGLEADANAWLARLEALPAYYRDNVANARRGVATGLTQPRLTASRSASVTPLSSPRLRTVVKPARRVFIPFIWAS